MKALRYMLFTMVLVLGILGFTGTTHAFNWEDGWEDSADYMSKDENGNLIYVAESYKDESYEDVTEFRLFVPNAAMNVSEAKFYSSNTKVAKFASGNDTVKLKPGDIYCVAKVKLIASGTSTITAKLGDKSYSFKIIVKPYMAAKMNSAKIYNYNSVKLSWKKVDCATGYIIVGAKRTGNELPGEFEVVKHIDDADATSAIIKSKLTLHYLVLNNQGNVICTKTYKNMEFTASSQPILYNGAINWVDAKYTYKKVKWNKQTFWDHKESHYYYRIPAVVK